MSSPAVPRYVGRAAERDRLSSVLGQLRAGLSAVLVLSGEAGIGKTYLLRWLAENAAGIRTVLVSGYEAEVGLGFAALHRLLLPLLSDPAELPDPQRDALGTAFGLVSGPAQRRTGTSRATRYPIPEYRLVPMPEPDMRSLLFAAAATPPAPHVGARLIAESGGNPLGFRHPLIRSVVYDCADAAARQRVHTALAQASAARELADAAAWHRAHAVTGPDESVAAQLELTAARARERGGYAAEANFLTLAAQRGTTGTTDHTRRLLAAAHPNIIAGDGTLAEQLLE